MKKIYFEIVLHAELIRNKNKTIKYFSVYCGRVLFTLKSCTANTEVRVYKVQGYICKKKKKHIESKSNLK